MPDAQKLTALIAEYQSLDRTRDADRMRQTLEEAITELDRTTAQRSGRRCMVCSASFAKTLILKARIGCLPEGVGNLEPGGGPCFMG